MSSQMGTAMVTLIVGPQKHVFTVHSKLLCDKVKYFKAMFDGEFEEASSGVATFPEDDVQSFDLMLFWLHTGKLPIFTNGEADAAHGGDWHNTWGWALKLYVLADKFRINELIDLALDTVIQEVENKGPATWSHSDIEHAYEVTPRHSFWSEMLVTLQAHDILFYLPDDGRDRRATKMLCKNEDLMHEVLHYIRIQAGRSRKEACDEIIDKWRHCHWHTHTPGYCPFGENCLRASHDPRCPKPPPRYNLAEGKR